MKKWKLRFKDKWTNGKWSETTAIMDDSKTESDMKAFWGVDGDDVIDYEITCEDYVPNPIKKKRKIMFNDKYGLTEAVLEGRKVQTRRLVP